MNDNKILSCDLIKCNCEGAEFPIFLSAPTEVLQRIKLLVILYHNYLAEGHSEMELAKHFKKAGFHVRIRFRGEYRGWIVAENKAYYSHPWLRSARIKLTLVIRGVRRRGGKVLLPKKR